MLKIGHRGARGLEPENTLRSFEKAIQLGADMIEFDVQLTKDKEIVVIHDLTVDRTTDGKGKVGNLTLGQIKQLDAGQGEKVPTLIEALEFLKGRCQINIEAKSRKVINYLTRELKARDLASMPIYISSNYFKSLEKIEQALPKVKVAWTFKATDSYLKQSLWIFLMFIFYPLVKHYVVKRLKRNGIDVVSIHHLLCSRNFIDKIHQCNKIAFAWTVNRPGKIAWLKEWGVDGIFSDYPDRL